MRFIEANFNNQIANKPKKLINIDKKQIVQTQGCI